MLILLHLQLCPLHHQKIRAISQVQTYTEGTTGSDE